MLHIIIPSVDKNELPPPDYNSWSQGAIEKFCPKIYHHIAPTAYMLWDIIDRHIAYSYMDL